MGDLKVMEVQQDGKWKWIMETRTEGLPVEHREAARPAIGCGWLAGWAGCHSSSVRGSGPLLQLQLSVILFFF